ncbi:MAG: hypothetical protein ACRC6B_05265, partial [Fusobacteriaceae bacterium]
SAKPKFEKGTNLGYQYYDTGLKRPVYWDGMKWVDSIKETAMQFGGGSSIPAKIYGLQITNTGTQFTYERTDLSSAFAVTQETGLTDDLGNAMMRVKSAFSDVMPWKGITKVILDNEGEVVDTYGSSTFEETFHRSSPYRAHTHSVMVQIPKFYYSYVSDGANQARIIDVKIADHYSEGFELAPLFYLPDGSERDFAYISAYESVMIDTNGPNTSNEFVWAASPDMTSNRPVYGWGSTQVNGTNLTTRYKMASCCRRNQSPPMSKSSFYDFRIMSESRGGNFHQLDYASMFALQLLMVVEFGTMNLQTIFSGVTNLPYSTAQNYALTVGYTLPLGNNSGWVEVSAKRDNNTIKTKPFSYRGIENPYGNTSKLLEGAIYSGQTRMVKTGTYDKLEPNNYADYTTMFVNEKETPAKVHNASSSGITWWSANTQDDSFLPAEG